MAKPGVVDINATVAAWADIVIKIWQEKITELQVYDKGYLEDSLMQDLMRSAGQDIEKVEFSFKLYGIFVDMGVGKELAVGNTGYVDVMGSEGMRGTARRAKPWYSKKFYNQIMKLREILMERYSKSVAYTMLNTFNEAFDKRSGDILHSKSVGSLRTVRYRKQQSIRNARNYQRRRAMDGRWRGSTWTTERGLPNINYE